MFKVVRALNLGQRSWTRRIARSIVLASLLGACVSTVSAASDCSDSLQSLIDAAAPGGVVNVPACTYREQVTIARPLTLIGQPGAEIRGSDVWTAWRQAGPSWISDQTVPPLPVSGNHDGRCGEASNRCLLPQQVFSDGVALYPVPVGTVPATGQFALDDARHVVLADDPQGRTLEVTTRQHWIVTASAGVTIEDMTMRHAGNDAQTGAVSNDGFTNWTIQDSTLSDAHGAVVNMQKGSQVRVLRNDISRGGDMGIHGTGVSDGLVQGNRIHHNNTDKFSTVWGAGGLKAAEVNGLVMDGNEVDANAATGLWCDVACKAVTFSNNRVHHNLTQGILFEISDGGRIVANSIWENGWGAPTWGQGAGIMVSTSANVEVADNAIAWNKDGISVIEQTRADGLPVRNIAVHDNTIVRGTVDGDYWSGLSLAWLNDGGKLYDLASNNHGTNNTFWYDQPENDIVRVSWLEQYERLADSLGTPGGQGGRYLTDAEKDKVLSDRAMPSDAGPILAQVLPQ